MDTFLQLLQQWNIDLLIVAIVLISGFFQQKYLCKITVSKDSKYDAAVKTLVVSLVASLIYIALQYKDVDKPWAKLFISYFFATSLYEILIRPFLRFIQKASGEEETNNNQPTQ